MFRIFRGNPFLCSLLSLSKAALLAMAVISCAGNPAKYGGNESSGRGGNSALGGARGQTRERQNNQMLIVESPQEAIYNGFPQPLKFIYNGKDEPEIVYYYSIRDLEEERGGTYTAPALVGTYYVLVRCLFEETTVEYKIRKSPVKIITEMYQEAVFNGTPKRITARADPPVPLSYTYYPNKELRDAAIKAAEKAALDEDALMTSYKGYIRVDSAPSGQGLYYVWIYFPGDENHESSQANVEFTISPALPQRSRQ